MNFHAQFPALLLVASFAYGAPRCDDPAVRKELLSAWERMAQRQGEQLAGSKVTIWGLRQDGKTGECRADFLAKKPDAHVGGSLPFSVKSGKNGKIEVAPRGEPTFQLLQADTSNAG